jgi:tetratricopeptide (TPR) repeat protein
MTSLTRLEQIGLEALNSGNYLLAIDCFKQITTIQPNYEHGACFYNLACSYEDIGKIDLARKNYEKALTYGPQNPIYLGGYASFLYLHGDAKEAFLAHLNLLKIRKSNPEAIEEILQILNLLSQKLDWNPEKIQQKIKEALE